MLNTTLSLPHTKPSRRAPLGLEEHLRLEARVGEQLDGAVAQPVVLGLRHGVLWLLFRLRAVASAVILL